MMGLRPQLYIQSFVEIGPLVPEKKIFEGFYHIWAWRPSSSYDTDAANTLSRPTHRGSTQNLILIGQAVSEEKILKNVSGRQTDGRRSMGIL